MGKVKKSRGTMLKEKGLDKETLLMERLISDDNLTPEQIKLFNEARHEYTSMEVEDPIFVLENKDLMKLRLDYYIELMKHTIRNNTDSISEQDAEILLDNKYILYITHMLNN